MANKIMTISRQYGSGGRDIGRRVAENLGIKCYDSEILAQVAEKSGFDKEYVNQMAEYAKGILSFAFDARLNGASNQDKIWLIQHDLILELAQKEPCVIVGRCADYILSDREDCDCINVFIHGSMEDRIRRIVEDYGFDGSDPKKRLKETDKQRSNYYRYYTDLKWGEMKNYQIALDSSVLGVDKCVEILTGIY